MINFINLYTEITYISSTWKPLSLNNLANTTEPKPIAVNEVNAVTPNNSRGKLISYAKEEEFLATLKKLQRL